MLTRERKKNERRVCACSLASLPPNVLALRVEAGSGGDRVLPNRQLEKSAQPNSNGKQTILMSGRLHVIEANAVRRNVDAAEMNER
jgi:hypothetical protein